MDLEKIILEAVDEINPMSAEKQRQSMKADELKPFKASKKKDSDDDEVDEAEDDEDTPVDKEASNSAEGPAEVEKIPEVTAGKLVKILNTMRSGKSLSDKQVRMDFQKYFNTLGGDDRVAFYTFLNAVNKIVTDEDAELEDLPAPEDMGVDIKTAPRKKKASKPSEDENAPIVVGEAANKSSVRKTFRRNR